MSLILLIRANQYPMDRIQWIKFDTKNKTVIEQGQIAGNQIKELQLASQECLVTFVIPGQELRSIDVELPVKKKSLLKSLPFIIEENLATPIEKMHIVAGREYSGKQQAFAISHEKMEYWQRIITDSGINVSYLCADFQLMQREDNSLLFEKSRAITSTEQLQGNLSEAGIFHFIDQYKGHVPLRLIAEKLPLSLEKILQEGKAIHLQTTKPMMEYLATGFSIKQPPTNLLSGVYQAPSPLKEYWFTFKKPIVAAACLALLVFGQLILGNYETQRQIEQIDQQMLSLYKETFPQSKKVPDPVRQMRAKLKQQENHQYQVLLPWLATAAPLLGQYQVELVNLRFDQKQKYLRLQLTAPDFSQMERLNTALQSEGLQSQLGTLVKNKEYVSGLLSLGGR